MTSPDPQPLCNLLQDRGDSPLRKIIRHSQRLLAIDKLLGECLPQELFSHCRTVQASVLELTIAVDSAVWLTHLRYLKPRLLAALKTHPQCFYLKDLQFRIQSFVNEMPIPAEKKLKPKSLSQETRELLQHTADSVDDPVLKEALRKLANSSE